MKRLAENLWEAVAPLKLPGLRMDHRMSVVRLATGELLVHSPIEYSQELGDSLRALGEPRWFMAPSRFHDMYWPQWFGAFPKARFVAARGVKQDHPELPFSDVLEENTNFWDREISAFEIRGAPKLNEVALLHAPSRSLIVADLIFNIDAAAQNIFGRFFLRMNGIYRKPGISRIYRSCIKDKSAFIDSVQQIRARPFDRLIIGHGPNLAGNSVLDRALQEAGFNEATKSAQPPEANPGAAKR
jgi:hypothetical protein